jgi:hypothetical protein
VSMNFPNGPRILFVRRVTYCFIYFARACSTNGRDTNAYEILVKKPEGKRSLVRSMHRSRIVRWPGHVARMEEVQTHTKF